MATYSIQGPDGKIYDIEGPDGADSKALGLALQKQLGGSGGQGNQGGGAPENGSVHQGGANRPGGAPFGRASQNLQVGNAPAANKAGGPPPIPEALAAAATAPKGADLLEGLNTVVHNTIGLPKQGTDWLLRQYVKGMTGLPIQPGATSGQMLRSAVGLNQGDEGILGKVAGTGIESFEDLATDPVTYGGLGAVGKIGKVGTELEHALNVAMKVQMAAGAARGGKRAVESFGAGKPGEAAENATQAAIDAGMLALGREKGKDFAKERAGGAKPEATVPPPEKASTLGKPYTVKDSQGNDVTGQISELSDDGTRVKTIMVDGLPVPIRQGVALVKQAQKRAAAEKAKAAPALPNLQKAKDVAEATQPQGPPPITAPAPEAVNLAAAPSEGPLPTVPPDLSTVTVPPIQAPGETQQPLKAGPPPETEPTAELTALRAKYLAAKKRGASAQELDSIVEEGMAAKQKFDADQATGAAAAQAGQPTPPPPVEAPPAPTPPPPAPAEAATTSPVPFGPPPLEAPAPDEAAGAAPPSDLAAQLEQLRAENLKLKAGATAGGPPELDATEPDVASGAAAAPTPQVSFKGQARKPRGKGAPKVTGLDETGTEATPTISDHKRDLLQVRDSMEKLDDEFQRAKKAGDQAGMEAARMRYDFQEKKSRELEAKIGLAEDQDVGKVVPEGATKAKVDKSVQRSDEEVAAAKRQVELQKQLAKAQKLNAKLKGPGGPPPEIPKAEGDTTSTAPETLQPASSDATPEQGPESPVQKVKGGNIVAKPGDVLPAGTAFDKDGAAAAPAPIPGTPGVVVNRAGYTSPEFHERVAAKVKGLFNTIREITTSINQKIPLVDIAVPRYMDLDHRIFGWHNGEHSIGINPLAIYEEALDHAGVTPEMHNPLTIESLQSEKMGRTTRKGFSWEKVRQAYEDRLLDTVVHEHAHYVEGDPALGNHGPVHEAEMERLLDELDPDELRQKIRKTVTVKLMQDLEPLHAEWQGARPQSGGLRGLASKAIDFFGGDSGTREQLTGIYPGKSGVPGAEPPVGTQGAAPKAEAGSGVSGNPPPNLPPEGDELGGAGEGGEPSGDGSAKPPGEQPGGLKSLWDKLTTTTRDQPKLAKRVYTQAPLPEEGTMDRDIADLLGEHTKAKGKENKLIAADRKQKAQDLADLRAEGADSAEAMQKKIDAIRSGRVTLPTAPGRRADMLRGITKNYTEHMQDAINEANLTPFEWGRAMDAMKTLTSDNRGVLDKQDNALLSSIFGNSFLKPLERETGPSPIKKFMRETGAIHRAFITAYDISAPFHAVHLTLGALAGSSEERAALGTAFKGMLQSMKSPEFYNGLMEDLAKRPGAQLARRAGLFLSTHSTPEEMKAAGNLLHWIPGVAPSERAFNAYLNKLSADVFDMHARRIQELGFSPKDNPGAYRDLADSVNILRGRGNIPFVEKNADALGVMLFAPRRLAATLQMMDPRRYLNKYSGEANYAQQFMRQKMASSLAVGLSLSALTAASLGGKFELDPRSSDFGNVIIGNARFSFMGPIPGFLRTATQILGGQRKNTETGEIKKLSLKDKAGVAFKFGQSKLAPTPGIPAAMIFGDYKGQKFSTGTAPLIWKQLLMGQRTMEDLTPKEKEGLTDFGSLTDTFAPMAPNDTYDLLQSAEHGTLGPAQTSGLTAAMGAALAALGAPVKVHQPKGGYQPVKAPTPPPDLQAPAP